jgi:hypothetical protein
MLCPIFCKTNEKLPLFEVVVRTRYEPAWEGLAPNYIRRTPKDTFVGPDTWGCNAGSQRFLVWKARFQKGAKLPRLLLPTPVQAQTMALPQTPFILAFLWLLPPFSAFSSRATSLNPRQSYLELHVDLRGSTVDRMCMCGGGQTMPTALATGCQTPTCLDHSLQAAHCLAQRQKGSLGTSDHGL